MNLKVAYYARVFTDKDEQLNSLENQPNYFNEMIEENKDSEFILFPEEIKKYFEKSKSIDLGNNRNSINHGYLHPRFWDKNLFEQLMYDIARISKFVRF